MSYTPQYLANDTAPILLDLTGQVMVETKPFVPIWVLLAIAVGVVAGVVAVKRMWRR